MGFKDISNNLLNKGEHAKEQVKPSELSSMEAEFAEITTKLEQERQTREGIGKFMKHPFQVLTERPENILIVCVPLGLLVLYRRVHLHGAGRTAYRSSSQRHSIDDFPGICRPDLPLSLLHSSISRNSGGSRTWKMPCPISSATLPA